MPHFPPITGKELIMFLQKLGFIIVRTKGSHFRLKHPDGRVTTPFQCMEMKIYPWDYSGK